MLFVPTRNDVVMLNGGQKSLPTLHFALFVMLSHLCWLIHITMSRYRRANISGATYFLLSSLTTQAGGNSFGIKSINSVRMLALLDIIFKSHPRYWELKVWLYRKRTLLLSRLIAANSMVARTTVFIRGEIDGFIS
jgi:hypothetical protein